MKGYRRRRKAIRRPYSLIVIVCEGEKTEVNYFNWFNRDRYSRVRIEAIHGSCTDPKSIVEYAIQQISEYDIRPEYGDEVWCAFDVDTNRDEVIRNSVDHALNNGVSVALSNPAFEIWPLLHFEYRNTSIDRHDLIVTLRKYIPYAKNMIINDLISDKQQTAIDNAKRLNEMHQGYGIDLFSTKSNPSTQVFRLVENIHQLIELNRSLGKTQSRG